MGLRKLVPTASTQFLGATIGDRRSRQEKFVAKIKAKIAQVTGLRPAFGDATAERRRFGEMTEPEFVS